MPPAAKITAIIVAWNVRPQLERCLAALLASQHVELRVILVDNASGDGSADFARRRFPNVTLIVNDRNRGFAAAVNQALSMSTGDVVLINPDLVLDPDALARLQSAFQRDPHAGIAGPRITYPDGQLQPSVRRFPRTSDLVLTLMKVPNLAPTLVRGYAGLDVDYNQEQVVDQVMGSCFMIRRAALDAVGSFDENFYIWFEEVDFCKRAAAHGWRTLYVPTAHAIHEKGASFKQQSVTWKHRQLLRSMVRYSQKHFGLTSTWLIRIVGTCAWIFAGLQQTLNLRKPARARNL